jgi:O-glycosyl hydrolase
VKLTINPDISYQTMSGFGASDCWTAQYVGKYWSDSEREKAAKLLFCKQFDKNGNPQGIGLSIWRFNLGAGTIEQGDSSNIKDITRRAECFLDLAGQYNWKKQIGQQWFLEKAKKYGCNQFVAFSNSPPVFFTRNEKGYALKDGLANLKTDKYNEFADYLVCVLEYFKKKKGIEFQYISPVNEPQWDWSGTYQEGSPWQNEEIRKIAIELDKSLINRKLKTKIIILETASWEYAYEGDKRASKTIYEFFDKKSNNYIGNLKTVEHIVAGHSYWTDKKKSDIVQIRKNVKQEADKYNLRVHQTEWSLLSSTPLEDFPEKFEDASYCDIALFMAKIIHADLVNANVSEWSFWTSMDAEQNGFKNRFNLLRMNTKGGDYAPATSGGEISAMKTLWVLGNYSLFVRPGYKRIDISNANNLTGLMGTSFISPNGKEIVVVLTNNSKAKIDISISLPEKLTSSIKQIKSYLTNETANLKYNDLTGKRGLTLPSKSVTTLIYNI